MLRFVVLSLFLVAISVNAQSLKLNTITAKGGVIMPESPWDTGFLVGAEADMGEVFNGFVLVPLVTYWSTGYTYSGTTFDLSLSNIQLGADVHYSLDNVAPGLYAGGGLAFNFLTSEYPVFNYTTFQFDQTGSDTETKLGFAVLAGYNLKLGNMAGVVQGRYNIVDGFDTLELTLGILFDMAK
ncbi:MAG: hypothetical protein D6677_12920 [Calditrichaeota bacterium]|nr:MAG: hypothetical protein D6677_12920 [Calditrichota bacterium]